MKKLTTIITALVLVFSTSAFAGAGENVSEKVNAAFKSNYKTAINVNWTKVDEFYVAHFELEKDDVAVAYNEDGELLGTSNLINKAQLPQAVTYAIKEKYGDCNVSASVTQIDLQGKVSYFISLETKAGVFRINSSEDGVIQVTKKVKKPVLVGKVY